MWHNVDLFFNNIVEKYKSNCSSLWCHKYKQELSSLSEKGQISGFLLKLKVSEI